MSRLRRNKKGCVALGRLCIRLAAAIVSILIIGAFAPGRMVASGGGSDQVSAGDPASVLALVRRAYASAGGLTARFVQVEERPGVGKTLEEKGSLSFLLPDKMRWDYEGKTPHRFVVNGDLVWMWTPSRNQVVKRKMTPEEMRAGAATFLRGLDGIEEQFELEEGVKDPGGRISLDLLPKTAATPYLRIEILVGSGNGLVQRIRIRHRIGNVTTISFTDLTTGVSLSPSLFAWDVPAGAEVVEP